MTRYIIPHPTITDRFLMRMKFNSPDEVTDWQKTAAADPVPGYTQGWRWINGELEFGLYADTGKPVLNVTGDKLDTLPEAEVKSIAGREGVPYTSKTLKSDLVMLIRQKRLEKEKK